MRRDLLLKRVRVGLRVCIPLRYEEQSPEMRSKYYKRNEELERKAGTAFMS